MSESKKLRFMQPRGNPSTGAIIARGALIEISEPWASRFIADGSAVEEAKPEPKPATENQKPKTEKPKGKKKK